MHAGRGGPRGASVRAGLSRGPLAYDGPEIFEIILKLIYLVIFCKNISLKEEILVIPF